MGRKGRQADGEWWAHSQKSKERRLLIERHLGDGKSVQQVALDLNVPVAMVVRAKGRLTARKASLVPA